MVKTDLKRALKLYTICLKIRVLLDDNKDELASCYSNMGSIYKNEGDLKNAMEVYMKGLKIVESTNNRKGMGYFLNNIGMAYVSQGEFELAKNYFRKALTIRMEDKDEKGMAASWSNLALVYSKSGEEDSAFFASNIALPLQIKSKSNYQVGLSYSNIGRYFLTTKKNLDSAQKYYQLSLAANEQFGNKQGLCIAYIGLSTIAERSGQHNKAVSYLEKSLLLAQQIELPESILNAAERLKNFYRRGNNFKGALEMTELFIKMRDSIASDENKKAGIKSQLKYEYEKKAAADSVKSSEEKKVTEAQLKSEKTQRYSLLIGLLLVGIFAGFMVNRFRVTNAQKKLIEEQKKLVERQKYLVEEKQTEILDSIKYAHRIQKALITSEKYIQKRLYNLMKKGSDNSTV
jgi:tetratricopeptide (TPR) repeat protein